ncbi:MAG: substrate-binding domain-containing protein, partial [Planctomycetota bacterium]
MTSPISANLGPAASTAAGIVRRHIEDGGTPVGEFLPPVRELARTHSIDMKTMWRALKGLESEGLVSAVPRRGYRVLARANDPKAGCPLAYLGHADQEGSRREGRTFHARLNLALEEAAGRRGWPFLALSMTGLGPGEIARQLKAQRAFGIALDSSRPEMVAAIERAGIPVVVLDSWVRGSAVDSVMQDGQLGGMLAAEHLIARGCRRIAWFGREEAGAHGPDRISGALATLTAAGVSIPRGLLVKTELEDVKEAARKLLSRKDRPDGVIALWHNLALAIKDAADALGLKLGRELPLVGWCAEEAVDE